MNFGLCEHRASCHKCEHRLACAYSCVSILHLVPWCISPLSAEDLRWHSTTTTAAGAQRGLSCLMLLNCGGPGGVWEITLTSLTNAESLKLWAMLFLGEMPLCQCKKIRCNSRASGQGLSGGVNVWATHLLTEWQLKAEAANAEDSQCCTCTADCASMLGWGYKNTECIWAV